ncbi:MAG: hypothetical protein MGG11_05770 [Trichodesmium sp. MAG_R03]|nr:hypothetical protein [Trichodesmium sp. MAG_R03]
MITLAYSQSLKNEKKICKKGVANYVNRPIEKGIKSRRHSYFYTGNRGQACLNSLEILAEEAEEIMANSPQKRLNYSDDKI